MPTWVEIASAGLTFALALVSVALWTLRVAVTAAGKRLFGALIAGAEALTFTVAFSRIVADLDNPAGVTAYALGVGVGTLVGVAADERLSRGQSWVRVIVQGEAALVREALCQRRWPVTAIPAIGPAGPVTELVIGVDDSNLAALGCDLDNLAPDAFRTVERLRLARGRPQPAGLRQVGAGGRMRRRGA